MRRQKLPDAPASPRHELYWSTFNDDLSGEMEFTHFMDTLINAEHRPEEFSAVVSGWLNTALKMSEARGRFATAFYGSYSVNRIVGAANMFDLLQKIGHRKLKK